MLQHLYRVATLAIFFILLIGDSTVSATDCIQFKECIIDYNQNKNKSLNDENAKLYSTFSRFLIKLFTESRLRRRMEKYTHELDNLCDSMPLNSFEIYWPYQACKWLGYNFDACITYIVNAPYTEELPPLKFEDNVECPEGLKICRKASQQVTEYIARKRALNGQMQTVIADEMTPVLTSVVDKLEQQILNRSECPQDRLSPHNCPVVLHYIREYQRKQEELENVLGERHFQLAKFYEEQGKQMKLKEKLAVLIKQNSTEYGHCAIRPSSARNFTSPWEGLFYYAYKYLHMSQSSCMTAHKYLPPIVGNKRCDIMFDECEKKMKEAIELIEKEKDDLKCLTDLVANQTSYTALLKKLIENLEKDVQKKFISHRCISCRDVGPCHTEYLELQDSLNDVNQKIQNEYLKRFEYQDIKSLIRDKVSRMEAKIKVRCDIIPVSYFKYVYPVESCYWRSYLFGISLEQATHCLTPNFEKLPDLTQIVTPPKGNCTVALVECQRRLAEGKVLLASKLAEWKLLVFQNADPYPLTHYFAEYYNTELKYKQVEDFICPGPPGSRTCIPKLRDCKQKYQSSQERFDNARSMYFKEVTNYHELSGITEKWKLVDAGLNQQMEARCETIPEITVDVIRRPYIAPHEDVMRSQILQLDYLLSHAPNGSTIDDCDAVLKSCTQLLQTADGRINGTKTMTKYFSEYAKGKCAVAREVEYGIIKKIIALRELTAQNKYCYRVMESGKIITYLYDKKLI